VRGLLGGLTGNAIDVRRTTGVAQSPALRGVFRRRFLFGRLRALPGREELGKMQPGTSVTRCNPFDGIAAYREPRS
jgi:hypothetical protein